MAVQGSKRVLARKRVVNDFVKSSWTRRDAAMAYDYIDYMLLR